MIQDFRDLDVWKKSVALTTEIYKLTAGFPDVERYGMTSQIRRASTSIPANIAEGWGRGSRGEYIQLLTVARGSLMEPETHLIVASNLRLLASDELNLVMPLIKDIEKKLNRLIAVLRNGRTKALARVPCPVSRVPKTVPRAA